MAKTVKKVRKKASNVGRPTKYLKKYNEDAYKLCLLGATDKQMADFFNVAESTINKWKLDEPEFSESIKKGKIKADTEVANSLYKRANGYKIQEVKEEFEKGNKTAVKKSITDKEIAPDSTAQIFWLKNRQPKIWRDSKNIDHTTKGEAIAQTREDIVDQLKDLIGGDSK